MYNFTSKSHFTHTKAEQYAQNDFELSCDILSF